MSDQFCLGCTKEIGPKAPRHEFPNYTSVCGECWEGVPTHQGIWMEIVTGLFGIEGEGNVGDLVYTLCDIANKLFREHHGHHSHSECERCDPESLERRREGRRRHREEKKGDKSES